MGSLYRKSDKKNTWVYQYSVNGKRKYKVISNIGDLDKKQKRELYRKRADYKQSLGAFSWEQDSSSHSDTFTGNRAIEWIEKYDNEKPFFLEIGFPGPHPPYDPTPEFLALYDDVDLGTLSTSFTFVSLSSFRADLTVMNDVCN